MAPNFLSRISGEQFHEDAKDVLDRLERSMIVANQVRGRETSAFQEVKLTSYPLGIETPSKTFESDPS